MALYATYEFIDSPENLAYRQRLAEKFKELLPKVKKFLPKSNQELVVIHPEANCDCFYLGEGSTLGILPHHQANGRVDFAVLAKLNKVKPTGYDFAPEELHKPYVGVSLQGFSQNNLDTVLTLYISSRQHYPEHVIKALEDQGFTVKEMTANKAELKLLLTAMSGRPADSVVLDAYTQCRYLWAYHSRQFTEWERLFVKSLGQRLADNYGETPKQREVLNKLCQKYKVPKILDREDLIEFNKRLVKSKEARVNSA